MIRPHANPPRLPKYSATIALRFILVTWSCLIILIVWQARAFGQPAVPSEPVDSHLGVASCGGSTCHGAAQPVQGSRVLQDEYLVWRRQDKHARAYAVLLEPRAQKIASNLGLPDAHTAKVCLDCHTDNVPTGSRGRQFQIADGVGCEACHGGAQRWLGTHIAGTSTTTDLYKLGLFSTSDPVMRAQLCLSCHLGDESRFASHRLMGAGHPRLSFELNMFSKIQPAHYRIDDDYARRKAVATAVQTWAVGQAIAVSRLMEMLENPKKRSAGLFPELSFYDCHACHHPQTELRWQPRAGTGLGPGVLRFNDANLVMLRLVAVQSAGSAESKLGNLMLQLHRAMSEGQGDASQLAREIKAVADGLAKRLANHNFQAADLRALVAALASDGANGELSGYAAAEQATMALAAIVEASKQGRLLSDDRLKEAAEALDDCYAATKKADSFDPTGFAKAVQKVEAAFAKR